MAVQDTDQGAAIAPKLEIDWLKTTAGALAAVTTAVLLSTLGAVGTLIGAALGSVAATVGSALYAQGLAKSKRAVVKAQETALHKVGIAQAEVRRAGRRRGEDTAVQAHLGAADERLGQARVELDESVQEATPTPWSDRPRALPWKRVALVAAATFVVVVLAITVFEALSGRSVSSYTGGSDKEQGTTIGGVTSDVSSGDGKPDRPDQGPGPSEGASLSEEPAPDAPGESASSTPTEAPSPTPTEEPTTEPTPTTVPSPTLPTPSPSR